MGNEQSVGGQAVLDTGLRLSTLCQYHAEAGEGFCMLMLWAPPAYDFTASLPKGRTVEHGLLALVCAGQVGGLGARSVWRGGVKWFSVRGSTYAAVIELYVRRWRMALASISHSRTLCVLYTYVPAPRALCMYPFGNKWRDVG